MGEMPSDCKSSSCFLPHLASFGVVRAERWSYPMSPPHRLCSPDVTFHTHTLIDLALFCLIAYHLTLVLGCQSRLSSVLLSPPTFTTSSHHSMKCLLGASTADLIVSRFDDDVRRTPVEVRGLCDPMHFLPLHDADSGHTSITSITGEGSKASSVQRYQLAPICPGPYKRDHLARGRPGGLHPG